MENEQVEKRSFRCYRALDSVDTPDDRAFMQLALEQARRAGELGEVPVGAVVTLQGEVIAAAHNRREMDASPSAHAEFLALTEAARMLGRWRLSDCVVYVTLEPCLMCAGLMHQARIARCVYGASDPKAGALGSLYSVHEDTRLNHSFTVEAGLCAKESAQLLSNFFARLRKPASPGLDPGKTAAQAQDLDQGLNQDLDQGEAVKQEPGLAPVERGLGSDPGLAS